MGKQPGGPIAGVGGRSIGAKEGEEIELHVLGARSVEIGRKPGARDLLARLRKYRGRLPASFRFDRIEVKERA